LELDTRLSGKTSWGWQHSCRSLVSQQPEQAQLLFFKVCFFSEPDIEHANHITSSDQGKRDQSLIIRKLFPIKIGMMFQVRDDEILLFFCDPLGELHLLGMGVGQGLLIV